MPFKKKNTGKAPAVSIRAAGEVIEADFFLAGEVTIAAAASDGKGPRRFDMTAYTGGLLPLPNFEHPVVVDLAGMEGTGKSRPILKDHNRGLLVGHTDKIQNDGRQLLASGVVSGGGAAAREVLTAADNQFPWQASIGAKVLAKQFVPQGRSVSINGQTFAGPLIHATRTRLGEISFVVLGADDNTSARIAAELAAKGSAMTFAKWLESKGFDVDKISAAQKQFLQAQFDAEIKAAAEEEEGDDTVKASKDDDTVKAGAGDDDEIDPVKEIRAQLAAEKKRLAKLGKVAAKFNGKVPAAKLAEIEASAIDEEWDENKLELALIRAERPAARGGARTIGSRAKLTAAVIVAALSMSAGHSEEAIAKTINAADREKVMNEATSGQMRGFGLQSLMDNTINAAGQHFSGSRKSNDFIRAAFKASQMLQAADGAGEGEESIEAEGFSSMSLSNILSNVANKGLIASYSAVEVAWPNLCGVRNHSDFKVHSRYRLDSTGAFKKVAADGELKHVGLTDATYTNQLATYGAIIALTRQMMYNDDLGAFMEIPNLLGRMSALRLEEAVFVLLLSNPSSFFASGNNNLVSGAASALSITSLTTAEQKFSDFVDSNNKPILVSPNRILAGSALRTTANKLFRDTTLIATSLGSTSSKVVEGNNNPHVGKYTPYFSPYLNNTAIKDQDGAAISGQSSTLWFLLADPAVRAAISVAFLNGQRTPTIESSQTDFDTLGMQWRAFHDFGVGMEETTAAVQNAGV